MAKGKPTPKKPTLAEQYAKEQRRLKRAEARLKKQGFEFETSPIPKQPKRIRKESVARLQKITPAKLRKAATPPTVEHRKTPTKTQRKKYLPSASKVVLNNVREMISKWTPDSNWSPYFQEVKTKDRNILNNIIEGAIAMEGEEEVARRINAHAAEIYELVMQILYDSGGKNGRETVQFQLQKVSEIVMGRSPSVEESKILQEMIEEINEEYDEEDTGSFWHGDDVYGSYFESGPLFDE